MEKQDLISDFISDNEVVNYDEDNIEIVRGIWIESKDYNVITELIDKVCEGKNAQTSEKDLRVCEVCGSFTVDQVKELLFYGKTNDGTIVIDESNKKIDYVINFMFHQIHSDLRSDMEELFWKRIRLLSNFR